MRNWSRALVVFTAMLVSLAPAAQASGGNWLGKAFHHQAKPKVHPERDSFKARERQDKANARVARQRQRVADKHAVPQEKKTAVTPSKPAAPPQNSQPQS